MPLANDSALLIIDVQIDFCPGGSLEVPNGDAIIATVNALMPAFQTVVITQDWHPNDHQSFASNHTSREPFETIELNYGLQVLWPDHCVQGSHGAALHKRLNADKADLIIRKGCRHHIDSYSAFYENDRRTATGLSGYLRERQIHTLYLCGLATDFCVAYSAIDGCHEGFQVNVIDDACRAIDLDGSLAAAWEDMHRAGAQRVTSADVLAGAARSDRPIS